MRPDQQSRSGKQAAEYAFELTLPADYDPRDALNFNARDSTSLAEQVSRSGIKKGIVLAGVPVLLHIDLETPDTARCCILADGKLTPALREQAEQACRNILGLRLDPKDFQRFAVGDPVFGPLLKRQASLRVVQSATVFEALTWAIMGQQINVPFAVSLRRTFIQQAGRAHSSGLWCYPDAQAAARVDIEQLTSRQFSKAKAETLLRLANLIATGELDIDVSLSNSIEAIGEAFLNVKGIGLWTVNYALLRGYAHADCSLHGDVAVRTAIQNLTGGDTRPDPAAAQAFLKSYSPHRTMAAAHLWASLGKKQRY